MTAEFTDEQAVRDIRRAEDVIRETHALSRSASSWAVRERAKDLDVSVHAAALAVLSGERLDPATPCPPIPKQRPMRRRLRAVLGVASGARR